MPNINVKEHNKKYNTLIKEAIKEIERNGQAASNRVNIDGVFISSSDKERYEDLLILEDLLKIERDEKDNPLIFEDFVIPAKDYHQFMKIANKPSIGIHFSPSVYMYGQIPGTNIPTPRAKYKDGVESLAHYEKYLEEYYTKKGFSITKDENGIRAPYPHEQFVWDLGGPKQPSPAYTSPYYKSYKAKALKNIQQGKGPELTDDAKKQQSEPQRRTYDNPKKQGQQTTRTTQADKGRRNYVKNKKKCDDNLLARFFAKLDNLQYNINRDETWHNIGRFIKKAAVVGGAALLSAFLAKYIILGAIGIGGSVVTSATAGEAILQALGWVYAGSMGYIIYRNLKKKKLQKEAEEEIEEAEQNDIDNDLGDGPVMGGNGPSKGHTQQGPQQNGPTPQGPQQNGPAPQGPTGGPTPQGPTSGPTSSNQNNGNQSNNHQQNGGTPGQAEFDLKQEEKNIAENIKRQILSYQTTEEIDNFLITRLSTVRQNIEMIDARIEEVRNDVNMEGALRNTTLKKLELRRLRAKLEERKYFEAVCSLQKISEEDVKEFGGLGK